MSGRIRAERADVHWLDGARSVVTLTVDDQVPSVLMIDGEPFLRGDVKGVMPRVREDDGLRYYQVKPYRVDAGLLEGV